MNETQQLISTHPEGHKLFIKYWLSQIEALPLSEYAVRAKIYEEALLYIPSSYKLWKLYFDESMAYVARKCVLNQNYEKIGQMFDQCLIPMEKMPRMWLMYADYLKRTFQYARLYETLGRTLRAIPATQHDKIWPFYIEWAENFEVTDLSLRIMRRYVQYKPGYKEEIVNFLEKRGHFGMAAKALLDLIKEEEFYSDRGTSKYEMTMRLCKMIAEYPLEMTSINVEEVFRHSLGKYSDEIGNLWIFYADFFIRQGSFDRARQIFEEALASVYTARDFGLIYNSYLKFEEEMLTFILEHDEIDLKDVGILRNDVTGDFPPEEIQLARIETLIEKCDLYLNSCHLRQSPQSVAHWLKRFSLLERDPERVDIAFLDALKKLDSNKADGSVADIWIYIGKYYKRNRGAKMMNLLFQKALTISFRNQNDYSLIMSAWVEELLDLGFYTDALQILRQFFVEGLHGGSNLTLFGKARAAILASNSVWSLYLDVEFNFGNQKALAKAYSLMLEKRIASPLNVFNYLKLLNSKGDHFSMFKVCETALEIFTWPAAHHFWVFYLSEFQRIYGEQKVERMRDLYDKVLNEVPREKSLLIRMGLLRNVR